MPTQRALVVFFALILAVAAIGTIVWAVRQYAWWSLPPDLGPDPGKAAVERYILEYIHALNANDPGLLSEVVGRQADTQDIQERLRLYGGRDLVDIEVAIVHEFRYHYQVWITARAGDGSIVEMYQIAVWTGERWNMLPPYPYTGAPPTP